MTIFNRLILLLAVCLFVSCEEPGVSGDSGSTTIEHSTETTPSNTETATTESTEGQASTDNSTAETVATNNCTVTDKHFEKNVFAVQGMSQQVSISANASTADKTLGDSHRILRVVNTTDCSSILEQTLPINRSADFPYYLITPTYEPTNQILAIQGFNTLYFYDVKNKKLVGPIEPKFLGEKDAVDAQSGMIKGLTIWGNYLMGHSVDNGPFAFNISNPQSPTPVIPVAEYNIPKTGEYNYLFILENGPSGFQAILPTTDIDAGGNLFEVAKLFPQPLRVNTSVAKNVRNNRFIIFNDKTNAAQERKVVIDMFSKKWVDLPASIASKKTGDILAWLNSAN